MVQALEQLVAKPLVQGTSTIDLYTAGTTALYTGMLFEHQTTLNDYGNNFRQIQPSYGVNVIPYGNLNGIGGETHDSFKIDRYDNIYGGHTTLNIPGYDRIHVGWND